MKLTEKGLDLRAWKGWSVTGSRGSTPDSPERAAIVAARRLNEMGKRSVTAHHFVGREGSIVVIVDRIARTVAVAREADIPEKKPHARRR